MRSMFIAGPVPIPLPPVRSALIVNPFQCVYVSTASQVSLGSPDPASAPTPAAWRAGAGLPGGRGRLHAPRAGRGGDLAELWRLAAVEAAPVREARARPSLGPARYPLTACLMCPWATALSPHVPSVGAGRRCRRPDGRPGRC